MIDINLLRESKGGDPQAVRDSQRKRGGEEAVKLVDEVIQLDAEWITARVDANNINKEMNAISSQVTKLAKAGNLASQEALALIAEKSLLEQKKVHLTAVADAKENILNARLRLIGNIVHPSCVVSNNEDDNLLVRNWWPAGRSLEEEKKRRHDSIINGKGIPGLYSHHEVLEKIGGYEPVRGAKVAGHRGYFLTGPAVDLNLALIQYGLDFLEKRGFTKLWTPFFMRREMMAKTAQLSEFDEALYTIKGEDGEDNYLIATSEQPISAFHQGEWFANAKELPKKYAGASTCFRKEAGAHGRDTWGIFRVHQFEKVEQFCLTEPEKSWDMHEEMLKNSQDFYESLQLPYHVISIVSGALNNAAAKKLDLEAYFPFQGEFKELVSCSNCTDYQSRELEIRYGAKKVCNYISQLNSSVKTYVHALNCTLTATSRTICCILENYQTADGVVVPEVLRNYMGGKEFIPFTASLNSKVEAMKVQ